MCLALTHIFSHGRYIFPSPWLFLYLFVMVVLYTYGKSRKDTVTWLSLWLVPRDTSLQFDIRFDTLTVIAFISCFGYFIQNEATIHIFVLWFPINSEVIVPSFDFFFYFAVVVVVSLVPLWCVLLFNLRRVVSIELYLLSITWMLSHNEGHILLSSRGKFL